MKITRERKIIGTILALAMAGFGADRAMSSPEAAAAGSEEPLLMATAGESSNKPMSIAAMNGASGISLADRLAQLAGDTHAPGITAMRDVFHPSAVWMASLTPGPGGSFNASDADKFSQTHHLIATSVNGQGEGAAVIDGKLVRIGSSLDGFKLESIGRQSATFCDKAGARARLSVKTN